MRVYQQGVMNISGDNCAQILVDFINVVCDVNSFSLAGSLRLDDPLMINGRFFRFELDIMVVQISIFFGQNVRIRNDFEILPAEFLLLFQDVFGELVFPSQFEAGWEMVDLLELVQAFVEVRLGAEICPEHIPIMAFSVRKARGFECRSHHFIVAFVHFVQ